MIAERLFAPWEAKGKQYGEDFVILGYLAGGETALAAYSRDFKKAFPQDWRQNNTEPAAPRGHHQRRGYQTVAVLH